MSLVACAQQDGIGILCIDNPPVNLISELTVDALAEGFHRFEAAAKLAALVIHCAGHTFVAGGDIASF